MNKCPFMAFGNFVFIILFSVAVGALLSNDDVIDPFEHVRWERGSDYGTGVGGPVAAGTDAPAGADGGGNATDECPSGGSQSDSQPETVKDPSNSQCSFEKRASQVLKALKGGDENGRQQYKPLKSAVCNTEAECVNECVAHKNTKDKRLGLAFFYALDEKTLRDDDRYTSSYFFTSYIRRCQSGSAATHHASKRDAPLPRKRPPGSAPSTSQNSGTPSAQSDIPSSQHGGPLPRKRPPGSPPMTTQQNQNQNSQDQRGLPRKRPPGSAPSTSQNSGTPSDIPSSQHGGALPRKRPPGSPPVTTQQNQNQSSHSQRGLPRKRPPGSPPITYLQRQKPPDNNVTTNSNGLKSILPGAGNIFKNPGAGDIFKKFMQKFGKTYSGQDGSLRADIFQSNIKRMDELNAALLKSHGRDGAVYGWTPFADLTHKEFVKSHTGALAEKDVEKLSISDQDLASNVKSRPSSVDWSKHGVLGRIRSQGACGSCYAFSSADLVSAQNAIERRQDRPKTLSAQYIKDCLSDNAGCEGARVGKVMQNVVNNNKGVPLEQCNRYQEKSGSCQKDSSCCMYQKAKWSQTLDVSGPKEKDVIAGLLQWGPVVSIIEASEAWQFHNGTGIIKASQCENGPQDHAVLLTGYNYEGPTPYYIVRNSWGEEWGERGYGKLEAGKDACSVSKTVVTACAYDCDKVKDAKSRLGGSPPYKKAQSPS